MKISCTRTALAWLATSVFVLSLMLTPQTGATEEKEPPFVSGLLDLPISNYYITPRGLIVENSGVVAQPVLLFFFNLYEGESPLSNVTGTLGMFNSVHSKQRNLTSSTPNWAEMDLISALSFTFLKDWTFTFGYEYWVSPIDAFPSSSHIELKFAYSDHFLKGLMPQLPGALSINPYFNIFVEIHNKTANTNALDGESHYFELGAVPKYVFAGYPLMIQLPTYLTFPGPHYYDTRQPSSTLGVFGTGVKVTAPLTFIRPRYGKWSVHADLIYKHLINDGVVFDNINVLPPHAGTRNPVKVVGGLTLFF